MGRPAKNPPKPGKDGKLRHKSGRLAILEENRKHSPAVAYSPILAKQILDELASGKDVRAVSQQPGMPTETAIHSWIRQYEDFSEAYEKIRPHRARARAEQAQHEATQLLTDDDKNSTYIRDVRIRNLLRLAAIDDPMRYSDKMLHLHHHSGSVAVEVAFDFGTNSGKTIEHQTENPDESAG